MQGCNSVLAVVVPIKTIGELQIGKLTSMASAVPALEVIAVGKVTCGRRPVPSNLTLVDIECGVYRAMNVGAQHASAAYLLFMGIDDDLLHESAADIVAKIANSRTGLIVIPFRVGNRLINQAPGLDGPRSFHHQGVLFRRELLLRLGGYSERFSMHSDLDLMLRMQRAETPGVLDRPLVKFSKGGMSTSGRYAVQSIREFFAIYNDHGLSKLSPSFLYSIGLLLWYRARYLVSRPFGGASATARD